jgi:hypothetical protein
MQYSCLYNVDGKFCGHDSTRIRHRQVDRAACQVDLRLMHDGCSEQK